jgi:hypothetical protein
MEYTGIKVLLNHDGMDELSSAFVWENYYIYMRNLISFAKIQALGLPEENHALFTKYNIEAVTLSGKPSLEHYDADNLKIAL